MLMPALFLFMIVSILVQFLTGSTPFRYLSLLFLLIEAILQQFLKSFWFAVEDYQNNFSSTYREVKLGIISSTSLQVSIETKKERTADVKPITSTTTFTEAN